MAKEFAKRGSHVTIVARTESKLKEAVADIQNTANPEQVFTTYTCMHVCVCVCALVCVCLCVYLAGIKSAATLGWQGFNTCWAGIDCIYILIMCILPMCVRVCVHVSVRLITNSTAAADTHARTHTYTHTSMSRKLDMCQQTWLTMLRYRWKFSKVSSIVILHRKDTRALTFENFSQAAVSKAIQQVCLAG